MRLVSFEGQQDSLPDKVNMGNQKAKSILPPGITVDSSLESLKNEPKAVVVPRKYTKVLYPDLLAKVNEMTEHERLQTEKVAEIKQLLATHRITSGVDMISRGLVVPKLEYT